jgi:hypothetical protein
MTGEKDIDDWIDALAGREGGPAAGDARALRNALRERPVDELALQAEIAAARERSPTLLARARHDPVLGPALGHRPRRPGRPGAGWRMVLAAGVAGLAVALLVTLQAPEEPAYRDAEEPVYRLVADDPSALRDEIATALRAAGVEVVTYERLGREGIDGQLPRPLSDEVRAVLRRYGIPEPADDALVVEIAPVP